MPINTLGSLSPLSSAVVPAGKIAQFLMTGGSSAQAMDWTSSGGVAVANAATAGVGLVRVTGMSTAGAGQLCTVNFYTTGAAVPSSGDFNSTTSCNSVVAANNPRMFQVPGGSTGFSVAMDTSGMVIVEMWRK